MKRIGMGIVGAGFVGPHHIDAVRRLGFVDVVAVAGSSEASAEKKADALGARKAYGSYEALLDDPDIQVVHNATPNYLHYPVNAAAIAKGKHVVSDKPLAMTAAEAKKLLDQATKAGDRARRDVQLPRQPARAAGAPRDRARRHRHAALSRTATTCRTGCSRTPTTRGGSSPTRAARRRRSATSARTGAISRSTSAACASPTCSATSRPSSRSARGRTASREAFQPPPARTTRRAGRHQGRGSRVGARCGSTTARRARSRSGRSAPATRTISCSRSAARRRRCAGGRSIRTSSGSATATRPNEILQKDPSLLDADGARATRTCRAATRRRGRTRSAT